jgi:hypothetical protein
MYISLGQMQRRMPFPAFTQPRATPPGRWVRPPRRTQSPEEKEAARQKALRYWQFQEMKSALRAKMIELANRPEAKSDIRVYEQLRNQLGFKLKALEEAYQAGAPLPTDVTFKPVELPPLPPPGVPAEEYEAPEVPEAPEA